MSKFYLINNIRVGSYRLYAGSLIDDAFEPVAAIRAAGGVLVTNTNGAVAVAAALAQKLRKRGAPLLEVAEIMEAALNFTHDRFPKGADITGTGATVKWSDGLRRTITGLTGAATVNLAVTAGTDGRLPQVGSRMEFSRTDVTANTCAFVNQGPGAGTILTMPVSKVGFLTVEFNAAGDWEYVASSPN